MLSSRSATPKNQIRVRLMHQCGNLRSEETMRSKFLADCDPHHRGVPAHIVMLLSWRGITTHPALVPELRQTNGHYANCPRQPRDSCAANLRLQGLRSLGDRGKRPKLSASRTTWPAIGSVLSFSVVLADRTKIFSAAIFRPRGCRL